MSGLMRPSSVGPREENAAEHEAGLAQVVRRRLSGPGREDRAPCTWGSRWPVGEVRRNAASLTVDIPAGVMVQQGAWTMEWQEGAP